MKKYVKSFRLFFGTCQIRDIVIFLAMLIVFMILCPMAELLPADSFIAGFAQGVASMMGALCAVTGLVFANALYQYAAPATAGRKFFVSLPDSALHFRRAIAAANALGIVTGLVLLALEGVVYHILGMDMSMVYLGAILLFIATGVCDLTGFIRSRTARIISLMAVMCGFGSLAGIFSVGEEDETSAADLLASHAEALWIAGAAALAIFAAGLIYSLAVAEKKWGDAQ